MFSKSSLIAVVAFAAFVALAALLLPQVVQAQECIWDCDLGSDPFNNPGENSPGFSILYCFDQPCVVTLDNVFNIFTGGIPTASVSQSAPGLSCNGTTLNTITISGNVVAVAKTNGVPNPASAAEALFNLVVSKVICTPPGNNLTSTINVGDAPGAVISGSITILNTPVLNAGNTELTKPSGWPGCKNDNQGNLLTCVYPLGNDQSNTLTQLLDRWPDDPPFGPLVLYSGNASGRAVSTRMCKGPVNKPVSSVVCKSGQDSAVGSFVADALFNVDVNWAGSGTKTINPASNTAVTDIITPLFAGIDTGTVTCSANGGTPISATSCDTKPGNTLRCSCPARDMLPNGCTNGEEVDVVVRGSLFSVDAQRLVKFIGEDNPVCNNNPTPPNP